MFKNPYAAVLRRTHATLRLQKRRLQKTSKASPCWRYFPSVKRDQKQKPRRRPGPFRTLSRKSGQRHSLPAQPAEHATGSQDQTRKSAAEDGARNGNCAECLILMTAVRVSERNICDIQRGVVLKIRHQILEIGGGSSTVD